ncbi:MAG: hypothetical protein JWQ96_740 [Segetibacter sp.]|nr:hypothetical protein [Segetibacter sp.]
MERVGVLINKLQEQHTKNAGIEKMLVTIQLLHSELILNKSLSTSEANSKVSIVVPHAINIPAISVVREPVAVTELAASTKPEFINEKVEAINGVTQSTGGINGEQKTFHASSGSTTEQLPVAERAEEKSVPVEEFISTYKEDQPGTNPVDLHLNYKPVQPPPPLTPEPIAEPSPEEPTAPIEPAPLPISNPEPDPIPHFTEATPWHSTYAPAEPASWVMEVPTLAHQDKVIYELNDTLFNEPSSLNDKLKEENIERGSLLQAAPIRDLKKAISINDRHRFIHELFRGDETMYERSIKTINSFNIFPEAEYWIQRELKVKLGWDLKNQMVAVFDQLVKRRFS